MRRATASPLADPGVAEFLVALCSSSGLVVGGGPGDWTVSWGEFSGRASTYTDALMGLARMIADFEAGER
jgi:hypothetical protein